MASFSAKVLRLSQVKDGSEVVEVEIVGAPARVDFDHQSGCR
jgi:hypothetical protein